MLRTELVASVELGEKEAVYLLNGVSTSYGAINMNGRFIDVGWIQTGRI